MTGDELRRERLRINLTQKKLGEILGYTGASADRVVQNWEYGKSPIPKKHWRQLAELFEVPLENFIP